MSTWETSWEVSLPADTVEELLLGLVVRDLLHGTSFDLEHDREGQSSTLAVDYTVGDELEGRIYRLLVTMRASGKEDRLAVQSFTEELLEELVEDSEVLVGRRQALGSVELGSLGFERVPEEEERWDLVIPDWLAPDGAEVPFGFRSVIASTREAWPSDEQLDRHGRIVLVPHAGTAHLFAIPAPGGEEAGGDRQLPVVP